MTPKIDMDKLFFNRYPVELGWLLDEMETQKTITLLDRSQEARESSEKRMESFFPAATDKRQLWNTINHLDEHSRFVDYWKNGGSSAFTFRDDLLRMFLKTDISGMPIHTIRFPYDQFYLYFGETDLFPGFSEDYRIDGLFVYSETLFGSLGHGVVEPLQSIVNRLNNELKGLITKKAQLQQRKKEWEFLRERYASGNRRNNAAAVATSIEGTIGALEQIQELIADYLDIPGKAADILANQQQQYEKYQQLLNDPDSFDYEDAHYSYAMLTVDATVVRKNGDIRPLSPQQVLDRPYLATHYDFETHRNTIADSIAKNYREENGYTPDCHFDNLRWEIDGRLQDIYGNPIEENGNWRIEHKTCQDGSPYIDCYRLNDYRNVCNRPEYLDTVTRLVFNALCYLNWKDRDVAERYSDPKHHQKMEAAPRKKQERLRQQAHQMGYRKLWFCGYNTPRMDRHDGNGGPVACHWRRGHWRNQPHGEGRSQSHLTWIKPVIVNKTDDQPTVTTIYRVEA